MAYITLKKIKTICIQFRLINDQVVKEKKIHRSNKILAADLQAINEIVLFYIVYLIQFIII